MGTITPRKRQDGTVAYKAQIRIRRAGVIVHGETETFDRKEAAKAWLKKRETELAQPGAIEAANTERPVLKEIIERYLDELKLVKPIGRTKEFTLRQIAATPLGATYADAIGSAELIEYARGRILNDGVVPATVQNDLVLLNGVFKVAEPAWGYKLDASEMEKAKAVAGNLGLVAHAQERTRVPTMDEMERIMSHFWDASRRRKWVVPMVKIVPFAIFSTRRQEEIIRIRWDDLDEKAKTVLVRDVKHPRKKIGNHQLANLTDEALAIIKSMPRIDECIFPFTTDAVSAQFTRSCDWLEIEDLRFHDLRRGGVTRLFEMGWQIPNVAAVSLHRDWNMLRRYTNLKFNGDRYAGWPWLQRAIDFQWTGYRKGDEPQKNAPAEARA